MDHEKNPFSSPEELADSRLKNSFQEKYYSDVRCTLTLAHTGAQIAMNSMFSIIDVNVEIISLTSLKKYILRILEISLVATHSEQKIECIYASSDTELIVQEAIPNYHIY